MEESVMQGQEGVLQNPQEVQGPPQEAQGEYPNSKEQAEKFIYGLIQIIHEDPKVQQILKENEGKDGTPMSPIIGALAGQVLSSLFTRVYQQTNGASVTEEFAIKMVRLGVSELADLAQVGGAKLSKEDRQQAAKLAGDTLQQSMETMYGEDTPQGPEQQGVMQGGM